MSLIDALLLELEIPTPIQKIDFPGVDLQIKREDLNHPTVQGNKWRKLKYNLLHYLEGNYKGVVSFGGAFSNHIYATAAACEKLDIPCKLFLRGYALDDHNPTIRFIRESGAEIELLTPSAYRQKTERPFSKLLTDKNYYVIPEGGTNELGIKGAKELGEEILDQSVVAPDYVCVAAGTGGTAIGLIQAFANVKTKVLVFSSLKGDFLNEIIQENVGEAYYQLKTEYHMGGYGKFNRELVDFCNAFKEVHDVRLDPVYTGKMMYGINNMINENYFNSRDKVVVIHTGGMQGVEGFNYRYGEKLGRLEYFF